MMVIKYNYLVAMLLLLLLRVLHMRCVAAQIVGYIGKEKDALNALKASFNHPLLNSNWTGTPCYMSQPSTWYGIQCTSFNNTGRVTGIMLESMSPNRTIHLELNSFIAFTELSVLVLKNNSLWGNMMDFSLNPKLRHIDLSGNILYGQISLSLLGLEMLESLLLQDNKFRGPIPEFNQSTLKAFNVSNNNLNGTIPTTRAVQAFGYNAYSSNAGLCGTPSPIACNSSSIDKANSFDLADQASSPNYSASDHFHLYLFLLDVGGLLVVIFLFILYYQKSQKLNKMMKELGRTKSSSVINMEDEKDDVRDDKKKIEEGHRDQIMKLDDSAGKDQQKRGKLMFIHPNGVQDESEQFEMADLLKASAEGLGKGIFGNSYKAEIVTMNNVAGKQIKQAVVVKRLRDLKPLVTEEFTKQLQLIANLKHPNLLPLLAYYFSKEEKLLLYKYVRTGNLFNRMFGERGSGRVPFVWSSRLSVALGVARALEYLHRNATLSAQSSSSSSSSTAPHGNLKSSNVLLDENNGVLVSDYGFSTLVALPIATQRMVSYKSPEYQRTKKVSKESDVWSYGSLLLELLTGKISACTAPLGANGIDLCSWVHRAVREEWTAEIFDTEITVNRTASSGMLRLLQIAMRCCDPSPEKRPQMREILREMENIRVNKSVDGDDKSSDQSSTDDSLSTTAPHARMN